MDSTNLTDAQSISAALDHAFVTGLGNADVVALDRVIRTFVREADDVRTVDACIAIDNRGRLSAGLPPLSSPGRVHVPLAFLNKDDLSTVASLYAEGGDPTLAIRNAVNLVDLPAELSDKRAMNSLAARTMGYEWTSDFHKLHAHLIEAAGISVRAMPTFIDTSTVRVILLIKSITRARLAMDRLDNPDVVRDVAGRAVDLALTDAEAMITADLPAIEAAFEQAARGPDDVLPMPRPAEAGADSDERRWKRRVYEAVLAANPSADTWTLDDWLVLWDRAADVSTVCPTSRDPLRVCYTGFHRGINTLLALRALDFHTGRPASKSYARDILGIDLSPSRPVLDNLRRLHAKAHAAMLPSAVKGMRLLTAKDEEAQQRDHAARITSEALLALAVDALERFGSDEDRERYAERSMPEEEIAGFLSRLVWTGFADQKRYDKITRADLACPDGVKPEFETEPVSTYPAAVRRTRKAIEALAEEQKEVPLHADEIFIDTVTVEVVKHTGYCAESDVRKERHAIRVVLEVAGRSFVREFAA